MKEIIADEDAIAYLKSINRVADVGDRENHKGNLLTDLVSNSDFVLTLLKDYSLYPEWTGTQKRLENSIRYIYQTEYDEVLQQIIAVEHLPGDLFITHYIQRINGFLIRLNMRSLLFIKTEWTIPIMHVRLFFPMSSYWSIL